MPCDPVVGDPLSAGEFRVVQAELVGWLEGLTSSVHSAMMAKAVRQQRDGRGPRWSEVPDSDPHATLAVRRRPHGA